VRRAWQIWGSDHGEWHIVGHCTRAQNDRASWREWQGRQESSGSPGRQRSRKGAWFGIEAVETLGGVTREWPGR
jgi:hypothetical protein